MAIYIVMILLRDKPEEIGSTEIEVTPFEDSKNLFKQEKETTQ